MAYGQCINCDEWAYLRKNDECYKCNPSLSLFQPKPEGIPGENKVTVHKVFTDLQLFYSLETLQASGASFRQMAKWLRNGDYSRKILPIDMKRILDGWTPKSDRKRKALRLEQLIPVPVCPYPGCNEVHTHTHDERTYTPATQEVFPVGQAAIKKPRKPYTRRARPHFDALTVARAMAGMEI